MLRIPTPVMKAAMPAVRALTLSPRFPLPVRRVATDVVVGSLPRPLGLPARRGDLGGVSALRLDPPGRRPAQVDGALLYLHGGGYVIGSAASHRPLLTRLAAGTGLPVFGLNYRLAPEHPFPAAFDDALAAYRALRAGGTPANRIVLGGDSAGGGLALALAMQLRDQGEIVRSVALICPWVDLGPNGAWRSQPGDVLLTPGDGRVLAKQYVGGQSTDPRVSPAYGDLAGLPPLIVHTAGDDPLRPDAIELIAKARAAGVRVDHRDDPGLWHVFHLLAGFLAAGDYAVAALVDSILRT